MEQEQLLLMDQGIEPEKSKQSPLRRLNEKWAGFLKSKLDSSSASQLDLTLQSVRSKSVILPGQQSEALKKDFPEADINIVRGYAEQLVDGINDESLLGRKVIDVPMFDRLLANNFRRLQIDDPEQEHALGYWVTSHNVLPPDKKNIIQKVKEPVTDLLDNLLKEPGISLRLGLIGTGIAIENRYGGAGRYIRTLPIKSQIASDVMTVIGSVSEDVKKDQIIQDLGIRYKLDRDEVGVLAHPSFRERIGKSLALGVTWYTAPRQILGWAAFTGAVFNSEFRNLVDNNFMLVTLISSGFLVAGAAGRMAVDHAILKKRNMSPDPLETTLAQMGGKINSEGDLIANPKLGFLGAPLDIGISIWALPSAIPFNAIAAANLPYSIPAYIWAMYVDQTVFAATNVAWDEIMNIKNKKTTKPK